MLCSADEPIETKLADATATPRSSTTQLGNRAVTSNAVMRSGRSVVLARPDLSHRTGAVLESPGGQRVDGVSELVSLRCEVILDAEGARAVRNPRNEPLPIQSPQSIGQDVRRNLLGRGREFAVALLARQQSRITSRVQRSRRCRGSRPPGTASAVRHSCFPPVSLHPCPASSPHSSTADQASPANSHLHYATDSASVQ